MGEPDRSRPLDPAEQRTLDALAVRLAHDEPRLEHRSAAVGAAGPARFRERLARALVVGVVLVLAVTLLLGAGAGLLVGLVAVVTTGSAVALGLRR